MSAVSTADVREVVLAHVQEGLADKGLNPVDIPEDFDLLVEGVVDSFGLLELIGELEGRYGTVLDFEEADSDDLTVLGPFCEYVASQLGNGARALPPAASEPASADSPPLELSAPSTRRLTPLRRRVGNGSVAAYRQATRARDKLFSLVVAGSFGSFGRNSVVQLPVRFKGESRISIGNGCFIGAGSWLQVLGHEPHAALTIGDDASIAGLCVVSVASSVRIGRGVSFARGVYIADHAHEYAAAGSVLDGALTDVAPIEIGDGVWLGENAVVLPGVRIGERAVVGANSVVAGDIPAYSLAVGSPARVVRRFHTR